MEWTQAACAEMASTGTAVRDSAWRLFGGQCIGFQASVVLRTRCSGMLYVSHGLREHMGRYELLGEHLAENGILVFGHDHGQ